MFKKTAEELVKDLQQQTNTFAVILTVDKYGTDETKDFYYFLQKDRIYSLLTLCDGLLDVLGDFVGNNETFYSINTHIIGNIANFDSSNSVIITFGCKHNKKINLFAKNIDQSIIRTNDKREKILQYFKERITLQPKPLIENIIDNF
jgi:hypothetical protein